jgi:carbon monoxide dehydrogenase subunit G
MQFEGEKELSHPPKEVFAKLSDARFLVECIPGRESTALAEQHKAVCIQKPGFAFVRGTLEVTILIKEVTPETSIKYALLSKGIGSKSEVETLLALTPKDAGTHLHWTAEIKSLEGLLKAVPSGLIRGAAQKVIEEIWHEVENKLR